MTKMKKSEVSMENVNSFGGVEFGRKGVNIIVSATDRNSAGNPAARYLVRADLFRDEYQTCVEFEYSESGFESAKKFAFSL